MTNTLENNISHGQQSQLAKLLAMENITVQHQASAKTAMFDVKNRVLILPVWRQMSKDLYDMLVIHEVGHALDTPMFVDEIIALAKKLNARSSVVKGFFNVIEDARIDKRQKRRYPGSRRNYIKGYQELLENDFFGTLRRDVNAMTFIDRINIHFKAGAMSGVHFSATERPFLKRIEDAETVEEVYTLVEDVYTFMKQQQNEAREGNEPSDVEEFDDEEGDFEIETDFDFDDDGSEGDFEEDEDSEDEGNGKSSRKSDKYEDEDESEDADAGENSDDEKSEDGSSNGDINAGANREKSDDTVDEPETEKAWQKKQEELLANSDINYVYVTLPEPKDVSKFVDDYKIVHKALSESHATHSSAAWMSAVRSELNDFRNSENATISYMVKEFEMRKSADEYRRTATAKTGSLDTNKLHSYKYNDDIFRRITSVAEGKNHGFVMFIDWSGSMDHHLKKTMKQLFSLVWFCKRVQIPFEVYSFRSINQIDNVLNVDWFSTRPTDIEMKAFKLRNIMSSRMNATEMNTAMINLWAFASGGHRRCDNMGSTPLNEAIVIAEHVVNAFKRRTKVQVVNTVFLTDGESDGNWTLNDPAAARGKNNYIIQDDVSKKQFVLGQTSYGFNFGRKLTSTLLEILKARTGCNLIGFYVYSQNFGALMHEFYGWNYNEVFAKSQKKLYESEGFVTVSNAGYDEYYILRAASMDIHKTDLQIDSTMTKNKIKNAFLAFAEKKAVNRVLLQRFIKKIAA
jgi:hypothetical protein